MSHFWDVHLKFVVVNIVHSHVILFTSVSLLHYVIIWYSAHAVHYAHTSRAYCVYVYVHTCTWIKGKAYQILHALNGVVVKLYKLVSFSGREHNSG